MSFSSERAFRCASAYFVPSVSLVISTQGSVKHNKWKTEYICGYSGFWNRHQIQIQIPFLLYFLFSINHLFPCRAYLTLSISQRKAAKCFKLFSLFHCMTVRIFNTWGVSPSVASQQRPSLITAHICSSFILMDFRRVFYIMGWVSLGTKYWLMDLWQRRRTYTDPLLHESNNTTLQKVFIAVIAARRCDGVKSWPS